MKRILTLTLFLCLALTAWSSPTVSVAFVSAGVGGNIITNSGGTDVGPYTLTINGVTVTAPCVTYNLTVAPKETWTANEDSIFDPANLPAGTTTVEYQEAAWLDMQFQAQSTTTTSGKAAIAAIQQAIWDIFETTPTFTDSATETWLTNAEKPVDYNTITKSNGFAVLVPVSGTQNPSTDGPPQWFLIQTPEPGSFYMLLGGIVLIGIGRLVRRKRAA